jgi:hypothetical protein
MGQIAEFKSPILKQEATRIVTRVKKLVEFCRCKKMSVIFTAFARTHSYLDRPLTGSSSS